MRTDASGDALRDYLNRIGPFAPLTPQDEVELAKRIEVGVLAEARLHVIAADDDDRADLQRLAYSGHAAYRRFVCSNLKLVVVIAKHYAGRGLDLMDLIQNGNIGLDRAVWAFDYTHGLRFSTSAVLWIRQQISQGLASGARAIRIPVHMMEAINRVDRLEGQLSIELGREPTAAELAEASGIRPSALGRLTRIENRPISIDFFGPRADFYAEISRRIVDHEDASALDLLERDATRAAVRLRVRGLPADERAVLRLRFGLDGSEPMTLQRVGAVLGVSKQRAWQIETKALIRLRTPELAAFRYAA